MNKEVYGPGFRRARVEAIKRSNGTCQFCGHYEANHAHHWADGRRVKYPKDDEVTSNDLVALCLECHRTATNLRRLLCQGGSMLLWRKMTTRCTNWILKHTESKSKASSIAAGSVTMGWRESTKTLTLPSDSTQSTRRKAPIESQPIKPNIDDFDTQVSLHCP